MAKRSRPLEWLVGYLVLSALGAIGPALLLTRFQLWPPLVGGLAFFALTMAFWGSAGILYHESGRSNQRWARRCATIAQWLALIGATLGIGLALHWLVGQIGRWT